MAIDWEIVRQALEVSQTAPRGAELMLLEAIGNIELPNGKTLATSPFVGQAVDYGVGNYTDVDDPRQPNAARHEKDAGNVPFAVHTLVLTNPAAPYKCTFVDAYGPESQRGGGRTLIIVDQDGGREVVALGTGASKVRGDYDSMIMHMPGQDVVIAGDGVKFNPPNLGGAAVFLVDGNGKIISDEVRSLGLPGGYHFVYEVRFSKRD